VGLRFASIGSGSSGNALVVESGTTRLMMDCGFGVGETRERLNRIGLEPRDLAGIVVTHEHDDHLGGVAAFAKKHAIRVYLTRGTAMWLPEDFPAVLVRIIDSHSRFSVDALEIDPIPVPHDAREPVQYTFSDGAVRMGVVTDLGCVTQHVVDRLSGCEALIIECNHDLDMLMGGPYPVSLKQRVAGRFGHLSNSDAAHLVAALDCKKLRHLIAAHLSQQNNTPALARQALARGMNCGEDWIGIATQAEGFAWRDA
jgi:phosphoribosyl 1,2-cyclic phosphodiesterase